MTSRGRYLRALGFSAALAAALFVPRAASADASAEQCVRASDEGQDARSRGALLKAQKAFIGCAAATCPRPVRVDCEHWLEQIDRDLPSIVVGVKDSKGDVLDARVTVDGGEPRRPDGSAIVLDPGTHVVRFERAGAAAVERTLVVRMGERNRSVIETLEVMAPADAKPRPVAAPDTSSRGLPTASWVFGGVGVVGIASFATFGLIGLSQKSDLKTACSPRCTDDDVSKLRTSYIVADVSLVVGVVSLGIAAYFALTEANRH